VIASARVAPAYLNYGTAIVVPADCIQLVNGAWLGHADAGSSVMMQIPAVGSFVRALLPVELTGGYTVIFGVWVGGDPDEPQRAFAVWWEPAYKDRG